jgi:branched-chain amino acid transport system permease protein
MNYAANLLSQTCIFIIEVAALDLLVGYSGILTFGHAAFVGIGSYTTAIVLTGFGFGFFGALACTVVMSGMLAYLIGVPTLRLSGDYFVLGSLGFSIVASSVFQNWIDVTNGPFGIYGIPTLTLFGFKISSAPAFLAVTATITLLVLLLKHRLVSAPFGVTLRALREDELVVSVLGKNVTAARIVIFVIASAIAAIGGLLTAYNLHFIDPSLFRLDLTIFLWAALFVGGCASVLGNILGPVILFGIPEMLRFTGLEGSLVAHLRDILYGALLILLTIFRPQGIAGTYRFR